MTQHAAVELTGYRDQFPLLDRTGYFNACSLGPMPKAGVAALAEFARVWNEQGAPAWFTEWMPALATLRSRIEGLLHAPAGTVAVAPSASVALATTVSALLRLTPRRKVLIGTLDFPTLGHQFLSRPDVTVEFVPSPDGISIPAEAFAARIDRDTALVATSHVLYRSGAIQDVPAIADAAHRAGAYCLVDGYHSVGCLPVDVQRLRCDVFVAGCLKWLSGGPGTAFAYCAPELLPLMRPAGATGWMATPTTPSFDLERFELAPDARRLETGTWAMPSHLVALAGLDLVLGAGVDNIAARLRSFSTRIIDRCLDAGLDPLTPVEAERRCGIVAIDCADAERVVDDLAAVGVVADARPGELRLSPHWALDEADVDRGVDRVLDAILPAGPGAGPWPVYPAPLDRAAVAAGTPELVRYGAEPDQFAELWRPEAGGAVPVVALVHGGFWRRRYRLDVMNALARDLCARGIAAFNIEYRRVGSPGGGWPGAGADLVAALAALADVAEPRGLDLNRLVLAGHSAGGQLALWLAARAAAAPHPPRLVVSMAGVCDLARAAERGLSTDAVRRFLGGATDPASPVDLLPLGVPQLLVHGTEDDSVPLDLSEGYHRAATAAGDACELITLPGATHLDLIDPAGAAWRTVVARIGAAITRAAERVGAGD